jgi:wyosine [tRNA(Phe)-imidazoG37] synthetase (radical SAM superfamily)
MKDISQHDRGSGGSGLVYPVVSRRSGGLSLGINLFPEGKRCSFDCPYCEVAPFAGDREFSLPELESELEAFFSEEYRRTWAPQHLQAAASEAPQPSEARKPQRAAIRLRDICFSGNGEPTLSPHLEAALEACARSRRAFPEIAGEAPILIITNSTGFLDAEVSRTLEDFAGHEGLSVWAKLDSGTQEGFEAISRSGFRLDEICGGIARFARTVPVVVQTMVCSLKGRSPGLAEAEAYADRIQALLEAGAKIKALHLYTVARAPLESWAEPLSADAIAAYMGMVAARLGPGIPMLGFDASGERPIVSRW